MCQRGITNEDSCQGYMFYIMEKGVGNCEELIRTRAPFATNEAKVILIRDMLVKMIENIYLLVNTANIVWWDLKPGNTVYNFKMNQLTKSVEINPILIDLDERYLTNSFRDLLDKDKLNYLLGNLDFKKSPIFPYKLEEHHIKRLYSFIMCFSYINYFMMLFKSKYYTGDVIYKMVLGYSIFIKRTLEDDDKITPYDILRIIFNPKKEDVWLNASLQILIKTDFADSDSRNSKSSNFRRQFHHYNTHNDPGQYDIKYNFLIDRFEGMYKTAMRELGQRNEFKRFNLGLSVLTRIKNKMDERGELRRYITAIRDERDEAINNLYMVNSDIVPSHLNTSRIESNARGSTRMRSLFKFLGI